MKKRLFRLVCFATLAMAFIGCREKDLDMTLVQKTLFEGTTMNEITAEDAWNITIVQDNESSFVELEYSAFLEEYLQVGKEDSELKIGLTRGLKLPSNTVMNATIHTASVQKIQLSDAVNATIEGQFPESSLTMELDDASTCKGGNFSGRAEVKLNDASTLVDCYFHGHSCDIALDDASVFKGWCSNDKLIVKLNGASRMTTYGVFASQANVEVAGASFLNMLETVVGETMIIMVKEASEASVTVQRPGTLEGFVVDASVLYYQGNPIINVGCDATSTLRPL